MCKENLAAYGRIILPHWAGLSHSSLAFLSNDMRIRCVHFKQDFRQTGF